MSWNCFVPWSKFSTQFVLQPLLVCCSPLLLPSLALQMATCKTLSTLKLSVFHMIVHSDSPAKLIYKGTTFCLHKNVLAFKATCLAWKIAFLSKIFQVFKMLWQILVGPSLKIDVIWRDCSIFFKVMTKWTVSVCSDYEHTMRRDTDSDF